MKSRKLPRQLLYDRLRAVPILNVRGVNRRLKRQPPRIHDDSSLATVHIFDRVIPARPRLCGLRVRLSMTAAPGSVPRCSSFIKHLLRRVDTMNLTQWREGRKDAIIAPPFPISTPSFPRYRPPSFPRYRPPSFPRKRESKPSRPSLTRAAKRRNMLG